MAVAFLIAIGSTAYTDHTQAAQAQPTQGQEQQMQQQMPPQMQQSQGQQAVPSYPLNLPKQSLAAALNTLSEQTDIQVLFPYDIARSHSIGPLQGNFTIEQALVIMLRNTGLHGGLTQGGIIAIAPADNHSGTNQYGKGKKMNTYTRKTLLASMVGLFAAGGASGSLAQGGEAATEQSRIDEIIVTANRREQSLNDAALSIAAIGGEEISRRNLSEMNDYLRALPGVNFIEVGVGNSAIVTRGIGINPQAEGETSSPTGGIYFGEVSLSGLSLLGGSSDLKMIDLERVEILRGPQGTLFGSGALAGSVRYIPKSPNLSKLEGKIRASYSGTTKSGGDNTKFDGVINIPILKDVLAVRAVAYSHDTSGYVDNIAGTILATNGFIFPGLDASTAVASFGGAELYQNENDLGTVTHTGGRLSVLWQPTEALGVTLEHVYQDVEQQGQPYVELTTGSNYEQITLQYGNGEGVEGEESEHRDEMNITNLVIEYDLGWANFLSSSAWLDQNSGRNQDQSAFGGFPVPQLGQGDADVFSQELRLTSQLDGQFQYVIGAYYEEIDNNVSFISWASTDLVRDLFGSPFGASRLLDISKSEKYTDQLAYYGELSYDINQQFEVTLGIRRFDYKKTTRDIGEGFLGNFDLPRKFDDSGTNAKVNLSYRPDSETLLYMQWAEGFRLGNTVFPLDRSACDVNNDGVLDGTNQEITDSFDADSTENFELGAKLTLLDNRLQVNAAVYRIDWTDIPIFVQGGQLPGQAVRTCFQGTTANAGEARSQGFELEAIYQVNQNLRVSLGGAYTNAELTEDAPGIGGMSGDRLPSSPEYSFNLGLQYDFEMGGHPFYVGGDYAYVDDFFNRLGETGVKIGDYGQLNISAGLNYNSFNIEIFGQNLTDENALIHADIAVFDDRAYQLRPRTIGLNIGYQF